jgi:hypothetical protein
MADRAKNALELRLDAAATPDRVAGAANLLAHMLRAVAPSLPTEAVTLIVQNRNTRATIRTWTHEAQTAVRAIVRILENPTKAALKERQASAVATAIVEDVKPLQPYAPRFYKPRSKKAIATVDDLYIHTMRAVARDARGAPIVRGTTTIYTPVYRVGRTGEDRKVKARLLAAGQPQDFAIAKGKAELFFDAAKLGRILPVKLAAVWLRLGPSTMVLDHRRTVAIDVDTAWRQETGIELGAQLTSALEDAFDDLDETISRTEGRH